MVRKSHSDFVQPLIATISNHSRPAHDSPGGAGIARETQFLFHIGSGNLPKDGGKYSLYAAIIVKRVDAQTRAKTSLNDLLRD